MRYQLVPKPQGLSIKLFERLGFADHKDFRLLVEEVAGQKPREVEVDLAGVSAIDSAGLGLLVILRDKIGQSGGTVTLARPTEAVQRVFDIVHFEKLFTITR